MSSNLESLKYTRGVLKVLDQLLLPHTIEFVDVNNVQDAWRVIRTMQVRGAPLIAITAALGLAVDIYRRRGEFVGKKTEAVAYLLESIDYLRTSRPTAVNLFIAMDELTAVVKESEANADLSAEGVIDIIIATSEQILADDIATNRAIGMNGAKKILSITGKEKVKVLTICNTGSLATAGFGTALGVVRALNELNSLQHVYACETRPYNQGARLTAFEIVQDRLPGTLITDSMASALMALKGIDCVVVGADRIAANGDTANKIGTYQLAIAAQYHRIPFFVAAPTTTLDLKMASGAEIHIEERPAEELTSLFGQKLAPDGIGVWNPAFDVTPCHLIRGIFTELGVIEPEYVDPKGMSQNSDPLIPVASFLTQALVSPPIGKGISTTTVENLRKRLTNTVDPIAIPIGYERIDEAKIAQYVLSNPKFRQILQLSDDSQLDSSLLKIQEVGDGNLNFVYIIEGKNNAKLVIKQALPFVRCVGENWPLTLRRAYFEQSALKEEAKLTNGEFVPEVYEYDGTRCLIAMRFIEPPNLILRKHLIAGTRITTFAKDTGLFLARTLFGNSPLALSGSEYRAKVSLWSQNTAMCALTEKVIFTDPYTSNCPLNRWTKPELDDFVNSILNDSQLKLAAAYHKQLFLSKTESLIHGDLHTGSIMASEGQTFVIDPEFAFYGPIGFDLGAVVSNLYLAYFAYSVKEDSSGYGEWILQQIEIVYETFQTEWNRLWLESVEKQEGLGEFYVAKVYNRSELDKAAKEYAAGLWRDCLGFTGSKMIRRIIGIAHVEDLESIKDTSLRSKAEKRAIVFARELVLASYNGNVQEKGYTSITAINQTLARRLFSFDIANDSIALPF